MIMILYMINHSGKMNNFATIFDVHSRVTHNFTTKLCVASDPKRSYSCRNYPNLVKSIQEIYVSLTTTKKISSSDRPRSASKYASGQCRYYIQYTRIE